MELFEEYETELLMVVQYLEAYCGVSGLEGNTSVKEYLDPFSRIEILSEIAVRLNKRIDWQYDFRSLKTPANFLEALI